MGVAALEHLAETLDELQAIDLDDVSDIELNEIAIGLARGSSRLLAAIVRAVGVWEQKSIWRSDGSRAAWARLSRDGNLSANEARTFVRRAKALRTMPATLDALQHGAISGAHVDLLAKANSNEVRSSAFAGDEDWMLTQCRTMRFAEVKQIVQYWCHRVDPDGCERAGRDLLDATSLTATETFEGTVHLRGALDPVGGAMFREALRRIEHDLYRADRRDGVKRSQVARRAAALVEMAVRAHTAPASGRRPEPLVCILAGTETVARLCQLSSGTVVTPGLVVPHLSATEVQSFVFDDAKHLLGVSDQRTFRGWLRRAIQVRDRHCTHPAGCDEPIAHCDVDHIIPVEDGGPTSYENGRLQCTSHNRDKFLHGRAPP